MGYPLHVPTGRRIAELANRIAERQAGDTDMLANGKLPVSWSRINHRAGLACLLRWAVP